MSFRLNLRDLPNQDALLTELSTARLKSRLPYSTLFTASFESNLLITTRRGLAGRKSMPAIRTAADTINKTTDFLNPFIFPP
jgi:hypothetical protein